MKELKIVGLDGIDITKCLVNVKGDNLILEFHTPIFYPIKSISLLDLKKEVNDDNRRL